MKRLISLVLVVLLLPTSFVFSHPGGVDSSGGHFDRRSGQYHCHRDTCESLNVSPSNQIANTIKIATFNIQIFGKTKAGKTGIMNQLASIIRKYDVVAVQEIKDKDNKVPRMFLDKINESGVRYDMRVSDRTGLQPDDKNSQEQYVVYFNIDTIDALDDGQLYDDSENDYFQREPFIVHLKAELGNFRFVLITIHTRPESAVEEIEALDHVFDWAKGEYPNEDDFIALGDYNAGCTYAKPNQLDSLAISGSNYIWVVPHDAETNLATKKCAYDRIVITRETEEDYNKEWEVDNSFNDKKVSDHWPVWGEFQTNQDTGN